MSFYSTLKHKIIDRKCFYLFFGGACWLLIVSCSQNVKQDIVNQEYISYKDDLGREVKVKKDAKRFLPLAPSITELLYLICDTAEIVGRTQNCNYPPQVVSKPIVNNYPPDLEKILYLKPDLVITKDGMLSPTQAEAIEKMGIPVYFQKYNHVEDIVSGLEKLSEITHHETKGKALTDSLKNILKNYPKKISDSSVKKVLMLISNESYFVFGKDTYASDIIALSGGINAVDSIYSNPYPVLSSEYILKVDPDIIIGGEQVRLEKDFFDLHKELKRTKAYKNKQYFTVNDDYLSRPGPRVIEAIRLLDEIIQEK